MQMLVVSSVLKCLGYDLKCFSWSTLFEVELRQHLSVADAFGLCLKSRYEKPFGPQRISLLAR